MPRKIAFDVRAAGQIEYFSFPYDFPVCLARLLHKAVTE
jgi:hypothetical protein